MNYKVFGLIISVSFLMICTTPSTLTNTSNTSSKKKVAGYIELYENKPNLVSVFNMCIYSSFKIYRKDDSLSEYREHGILKVGNPFFRGGQCQIALFEDLDDSKPTNRYEIRPLVNGKELDAINITYSFKDSTANK